MGVFQIDVTELGWIDSDKDDPQDLCCHGKVTARIGAEQLEDYGTVSASALYLLKSLTEDHHTGNDNQMIPCCGHFLVANDTLTQVEIIGCPYGTDWEVEHVPGGVRITTEGGAETFVPMEEYREEVFRFADKVRAYYDQCAPKILPENEYNRNGYIAFWNEWSRRRSNEE